MKSQGELHVADSWTMSSTADIFTKNTAAPVFNRHIPTFVGVNKYMEESSF